MHVELRAVVSRPVADPVKSIERWGHARINMKYTSNIQPMGVGVMTMTLDPSGVMVLISRGSRDWKIAVSVSGPPVLVFTNAMSPTV